MPTAYPTLAILRRVAQTRPLLNTVDNWLLRGTPFVFRSAPQDYDRLRRSLAVAFGVAETDIGLVGSARLGFSLNPLHLGQKFDEDSDVDVVVVSEQMFRQAWTDVLRWNYSQYWSIPQKDIEQITEDFKQRIYWGHLWPDKLIGISPIAGSWVDAFRGLSMVPELAPLKVNGRLYLSWDHARLYHVNGLKKVFPEIRAKAI